jgi:hypothetical protein
MTAIAAGAERRTLTRRPRGNHRDGIDVVQEYALTLGAGYQVEPVPARVLANAPPVPRAARLVPSRALFERLLQYAAPHDLWLELTRVLYRPANDGGTMVAARAGGQLVVMQAPFTLRGDVRTGGRMTRAMDVVCNGMLVVYAQRSDLVVDFVEDMSAAA